MMRMPVPAGRLPTLVPASAKTLLDVRTWSSALALPSAASGTTETLRDKGREVDELAIVRRGGPGARGSEKLPWAAAVVASPVSTTDTVSLELVSGVHAVIGVTAPTRHRVP